MKNLLLASIVAIASLMATPSSLAHTIDTGTPNGKAVGALAFDSNDAYAGQVSFASTARIDAILAHVLGGTAGETFTIALYSDAPSHVPGSLLFSRSATFAADGWNGVSGLNGWKVAAGIYWVAFEIGFSDTLGASSDTGALLDRGVPLPLARTAFDAGGGYRSTASPLDFGLQLDATAIPAPSTMALLFGGLAVLVTVSRRRRR